MAIPGGIIGAIGGFIGAGLGVLTGGVNAVINPEEVCCGGTVDHSDSSAPKTIASRVITSMETLFRVYDPLSLETSAYWFEFRRLDDDTYRLSLRDGARAVITGEDTATALRHIMDRFGLIAMNGTDRVTQGLPEDFQPIFLNADFEGGEHMHFCVNGYPRNCDWGLACKRLFAKVYTAAGDPWLEPPAEATRIRRFHLEMNMGSRIFDYGEIIFPGEREGEPDVLRYYRMVWDKAAGKNAGNRYLDYGPELKEGLQQVVEACNLDDLPATQINFSRSSSAEGTADIFIDYENGRQIYRQYRDAEIPEGWEAKRDALMAYLDAEFDTRGYEVEQ